MARSISKRTLATLVDLVRENQTVCPEIFSSLELVLNEIDIPFYVVKNERSCVFSIVNAIVLDYESENQSVYYRFNTQALFDGSSIAEITVEVFVIDENEFAPVFS